MSPKMRNRVEVFFLLTNEYLLRDQVGYLANPVKKFCLKRIIGFVHL